MNRVSSEFPSINIQDSLLRTRNVIVLECPKCGSRCEDDQINVSVEQTFDPKEKRWVDSKRIIRATIASTFVKLPINAKCVCGRWDEHLHRRCYVCNFYWSADTVDSVLGDISE